MKEFVRVFLYPNNLKTLFIAGEDDWHRLRAVIRYSGCTSTNKFAQRIGLSRAEILYRIKRKQNGISGALAARIAEHFPEINVEGLQFAEGPMFKQTAEMYINTIML